MKALLEFTLPEDQEEFETASAAQKYRHVLSEVDNLLRRHVKYGNQSEELTDAYQQLRNELRTLLEDENIKL